MSQKYKLQPASFRDVKFLVKSYSVNIGRRVVSHEFPFGEKPFTEDLGKKSRAFNVDGFLIGDDYFAQRDKLIAACERSGSAVLVHPYLGRLQVHCQSLSISESLEEGGIANISFQFVESGDALVPLVDPDKISDLEKEVNAIIQRASDNFDKIYKSIDTVKSGIQKAKDAVNQVINNINKAQKFCADVAQIGNDLSQFVREVSFAMDKIILYPKNVSSLFEASFGALSSSIDKFNSKNDQKRMAAAASLLSSTSTSLASPNVIVSNSSSAQKNTPEVDSKRRNAWMHLSQSKINQVQILNSTSREAQIEKSNKSIIELTTNAIAISYLANAAASSSYASSDDMYNARNKILSIADDILEHPLISDEMFNSIQNMQSCLSDALSSIENSLPIISILPVPKNTNILSFLYENFENFEKEDDLITRNNIQDPFDIKSNVQLEVAI